MAFNTRLAPVGQIRLPFPTLRNDLPSLSDPVLSIQLFASRDLDSRIPPVFNDCQANAFSEQFRPNASSTQQAKSTSGSATAFRREDTRSGLPDACQESGSLDQSPKQPLKHDFQFIEIHEASGKADSAAESHVRSHLMRKYHENRRRTRKAIPKKSKAKGCQHFEVFITAQHHTPLPSPASSAILVNTQYASSFQYTEQNPSQTMSIPTQRSSAIQNHDAELRHYLSRQVICFECGELMLQVSSGDEHAGLLPLPGPVPSVIASAFNDPFDSLAIPVSHRMHSMIHQCKITPAATAPVLPLTQLQVIFYHALKTNPPIYKNEGLPALLNLMSVSLALGDAAAIHAMVALSLYQDALLRIRGSASPDWRTQKAIEETKDAASHHVMEAVRLLNKKFENPKESLSITSLICAAMLGSCTVRILEFFTKLCTTGTPLAPSLTIISFNFSHLVEIKIISLPITTEYSRW